MYTWTSFLVLLSSVLTCFSINYNDDLMVSTPLGNIQGRLLKSGNGRRYAAFNGIPYAKPPTGSRRFAEPEPIDTWEGVWEAKHVVECPQTAMVNLDMLKGAEDCLYLNVYVPRQAILPEENLDVIVHIHGGGFTYGSGHSYARPDYFMDRDVILVTINYRLGLLGFLSTEDDVVSGNNGLKDQVMALKWVQDNIAKFGGNPYSVTLTGLASGGASVHLHYLSRMSKGLFHRGYSQSGVALNSFALQEEPLVKARRLGEAVGCTIGTTSDLVSCLRERPLRQLLSKMSLFHHYEFFPYAPFAPVVEKSANAFIDKNFYFLLAKGHVHDIPWLVSSVSHEGFFPAAFLYSDLETISANWSQIAPHLLDFTHSLADPLKKSVAKSIKDHYFKDTEIDTDSFTPLVQMFSDRFTVDLEMALKWQAKHNKAAVYYYQFAYSKDGSTVGHSGDAQYFFYNMFGRQPDEDDIKVKDLLLDMLVSFAKRGKPDIGEVEWEPMTSKEVVFLNISHYEHEKIKLQKRESISPISFWQSLGFLENQNLVLIKDEL